MPWKGWVAFVCTQALGITAMRLGSDQALVSGVALLAPGVPGLYVFSDIHKIIMVRDARLAIVGVTLNAIVWLTVATCVSRLKRRRLS
jgi:predicted cobalt transporter CbtA